MSRPVLPSLPSSLAVVVAGCGKSDDSTSSTASTRRHDSTARPPSNASSAARARPQSPRTRAREHIPKPNALLPANKPATLVMQTNCGEIDIALDVKRAPGDRVVGRLPGPQGLLRRAVVPPHRKGADGRRLRHPGRRPDRERQRRPRLQRAREAAGRAALLAAASVAMAKTEIEPAGTSGSQFFIVTAEDAGLPADYALLGKVTGGQDTVDRIAKPGRTATRSRSSRSSSRRRR